MYRMRSTWMMLLVAAAGLASAALADTLTMADGSAVRNCFVRDEGTRLLVWRSMEEVGGPAEAIPRSHIKEVKVERDDAWDVHPDLPDLTVTFIERNPKLAGLHGVVQYDQWGRPRIAGAPALVDEGEQGYMAPEAAVRNLKLRYEPGEQITLTAHVKNVGFAAAKPFQCVWLIDGTEVATREITQELPEMEETTVTLPWQWQEGQHTVTVCILPGQPEIATCNNEATDALWGWGFEFVVHRGRVAAWHQNRTAFGTFCFEDYYRWHVDIMNTLFAASVFPSAPEGIKARVRLDRIVYVDDDVEQAVQKMTAADGILYDQGRWSWIDDQDRNRQWEPPTKEWRNQTEWSLPHELGHQLGLTDLYGLDYAGHEFHKMPDNGDLIAHFQTHPLTMMHWHGPQIWSEADAGYLNMTWDKPRGHFGDYYFAIPRENVLRIVDINGQPVPGAQVDIFQRGAVVDQNAAPGEDQGVRHFPVIEDGNFDQPVSREPVIAGTTDERGLLRLPNRPVQEVRTLNGFHREPNPFGNINVVGERGLMLVRVTKRDRPCYYWLEIYDFVVAWFRGQRDQYEIVLKTPYGSTSSPPPPRGAQVAAAEEGHVTVSWEPPPVLHEQQYLERPIGYRIYRRVSSDGLNDRPWFPVATVTPDTRKVLVDLSQFPQDVYWYSKAGRFGVTTIGELGLESELAEVLYALTP